MNLDIIVGLSAPIAGILAQRNVISNKELMIWNLLSLIILGITVFTFISTYYFTDYISDTGNNQFVQIPYLLLPAIMLPTAIFLHCFSLKQLIDRRRFKEASGQV